MVTNSDIEFYRMHGWWVSPLILDSDIIDEAIYGVERFYAGERDFQLPVNISSQIKIDSSALRQEDYLSLQLEEFKNFVRVPAISDIASKLASSDTIRLFHDQLVYKPSKGKSDINTTVGWHTDRAYWQTCTSNNMLTAWIPLTKCDEENGTMMVIDKSHLWNGNDNLHQFHIQNLDETAKSFISSERNYEIIKYNVIPGQVCFHHCKTIHGSSQNNSINPRVAVSVHMQDSSNQYRRIKKKDGTYFVHLNDILCSENENTGLPNYSDDYVCPILYDVRS